MIRRRSTALAILIMVGFAAPTFGAAVVTGSVPVGGEYVAAPENLQAREWFQNAKFGMFIVWGVYSVLDRGEWVMHNESIPVEEYEKLPQRFNPTHFDPDKWCRIAKSAGMRYITFTAKHHDGFLMYDSKLTDWDVVDRTPYAKDALAELADACRRHGLGLFVYYSLLDWHHPDYFPRGKTGKKTGRPESGEWKQYLHYMDGQLTELLSNYGPISGIWFDGWWDKPEAEWRLSKTYGIIHKLQPAALVGNNHHVKPFPGEDFQMFERGMPGHDPFSKVDFVSELPLESCETINESWGYTAKDTQHKSPIELLHLLIRAAGHDANLLLNACVKPDGSLQEEHAKRLAVMGKWLEFYGESIFGARGGPIPPQSWGVTTQREDIVYAHVLNTTDTAIGLPDFDREIDSITLMNGEDVAYVPSPIGTLVVLPEGDRDPVDTIIVIETSPRAGGTGVPRGRE
ncbi:MAG: alpha-L-fucosidase [Candidatus Hydrogenedentes bacterium]|nr:alpha-L-fucosidase [Candidatus Hydrogenedentota bacterium]